MSSAQAPLIHPTAVIDAKAQLDSSVVVDAYAVIGPHVRIDKDTSIGAHCVLEGHTSIGERNRIFAFNSIGGIPQDKKYAGEPCELRIGDDNTIREFCTINIGSPGDLGYTEIGDHNWIMAYCHIAHDCVVGDHTIFANSTQLAGHVHIGDWVILGGITGIHQFVHVGAHSMTGIHSTITADIPPFVMCMGSPTEARSMNFEGLRRRGFSSARQQVIKQMYKLIYRSNLTVLHAVDAIRALAVETPEAQEDIALMTDFLVRANAGRGIVR